MSCGHNRIWSSDGKSSIKLVSAGQASYDANDDTEWGQDGDSASPQGITENFTLQCIHVVILRKYQL